MANAAKPAAKPAGWKRTIHGPRCHMMLEASAIYASITFAGLIFALSKVGQSAQPLVTLIQLLAITTAISTGSAVIAESESNLTLLKLSSFLLMAAVIVTIYLVIILPTALPSPS